VLPQGISYPWNDSIRSVDIQLQARKEGKRFRFYGICSESVAGGGIVYHSTGVGAAAFRSILILDKLPEQAPLLQPDIVLLDFGTNDILYHNRIETSLVAEVEKAIALWRNMFPDVLLVLTSTQDLFYKKRSITAGIEFRNLMDSLARANQCLFWNWFDLSGGLNTIRDWASLGYAKTDHVHLTKDGYRLKGSYLYESFMNTLNILNSLSNVREVTVPLKDYSSLAIPLESSPVKPNAPSIARKYTVKSGDTLFGIARKYHTTVSKLKSLNGLHGDVIRIGQVLRIP
jgi:LysM repeat protein